MLTIYRRHLTGCAHRPEGRRYRRCRCPIWVDRFLNGLEIRESLKMRDWEKAQEKIREWEADGNKRISANSTQPITIEQSCEAFLEDARARKLADATLYKYELLFRQLRTFTTQQGVRFLHELHLTSVRQFRASWKDGNIAASKKLERLRAFFRFAHESDWTEENPAQKIKNPKIHQPPTLPFNREQMVKMRLGVVEAAAVEPASEKARHAETTCVADSPVSAATSEPARTVAT
jgi:hypothetical protein